jgi:phosphoenolpyruvate carboxykinase (ATP)
LRLDLVTHQLQELGLRPSGSLYVNIPVPSLIERSVERREGLLAATGALVAKTFERTGRSPNDKFIVRDSETDGHVWWEANQAITVDVFERLWRRALAHLSDKDLFITDAWACADPDHRLELRVISELGWHALFARQLFRRPSAADLESFQPSWTVLSVPTFRADPFRDGTNSHVFVSIDFARRRVLVVGTHYAGEIKKSIFTVLNYLLPHDGVMPMHCSANLGAAGDVALFFGLSGTGKTTLSADPERRLIGDDEHGWSDRGVFNFEGGCYAKCIRLSQEKEPQIWNAIRFGSVVENVVVDPVDRDVDYDDDSITENTRAAYPLDFIPGAVPEGFGGHARTIVFLAADASGVLPPVARLSREQAAYHFLSGFTSKLAGTETGLGSEPEATFSTCFGSPFLPRHPTVYSSMLLDKIDKHDAKVFLVNTGWSGGPFGVGERIDIDVTRKIVSAAVGGELDRVPTQPDPVFGFEVPMSIEGVPDSVLRPRDTWKDPGAYDTKAKELATKFEDNFEKFSGLVDEEVAQAGPVA